MISHTKQSLDVVLIYRNYARFDGVSHVGLGVNAVNTAKVLNQMGIKARVLPCAQPQDILPTLKGLPHIPTHVIIQALWVPVETMGSLISSFPDTQIASTCHSNVGFLQAEPRAILLFKEYLSLERETVNFHAAGNSLRFCQAIEESFTEPCTYLPNLYWTHHKHGEPKRLWRDIGGTLRIGVFGASRVQKNMLSGAMAAMEIASNTGAFTELYISGGRNDGGPEASQRLRLGVKNLLAGMPNIKLIEVNWQTWTSFLKTVSAMNMMIQPSYSESFNVVTADGCAEGIPSVVSSAVTWAPESWKADADDANDIARVGCGILGDPMAAIHGFHALQKHNKVSQNAWLSYLLENKFGNPGI
jgi:hypothetical protein